MVTFVRKAVDVETQAMSSFARLLEVGGDFENNEDFSTAVRYAITYHGIPASEFADEFGVSPATVSRWSRGKSVPHPMARPRIIRWITSEVQKHRMELEQQVPTTTHGSKSNKRILVSI